MNGLLEQLWSIFEAEAREQLQAIRDGVLELERTGDAEERRRLMRVAHSLKGGAASLGLTDLERLAHAVEDAMAGGPDGRPVAGAVEAILSATGVMLAALEPAARGAVEGARHHLERLLAVAPRRAAPAAAPAAPWSPADLGDLGARLRALTTLEPEPRAAAALEAAEVAARLAAGASGEPAAAARRIEAGLRRVAEGGERLPREVAAVAGELVALGRLVGVAMGPAAPTKEPPAAPTAPDAAPAPRPDGPADATVRVAASTLEEVGRAVDVLVALAGRHRQQGREVQRTAHRARELPERLTAAIGALTGRAAALPPDVAAVVTDLEGCAGELAQFARQARRDADQVTVAAAGLRQALRDLRMVPAGMLLAPLRSAVRELATRLGKTVRLELVGAEVRIDRRLVDELKAPLLHLVRNAVDHGVEPAARRVAAGKPPAGALVVRVEPRGGRISLLVADDGPGLDPAHLRKVAVERGLIAASEAGRLSDAEAARLAFRSGLSTASALTEVSGRGVGLEVVEEAARRLGGSVDVTWVAGGGTTFTLDLPLTLATATGLLLRVGGTAAAIPAEAVEQVLWLAPQELTTVAGRAVALVDGAPVPIEPLSQALGLSGAAPAPLAGRVTALLLAAGGRRAAFMVDEVLGEEELVVATLGSRLGDARAVAGASALPDGRIVAVLNPAELLHLAHGNAAQGAAHRRPRVVVADDSLTTRAAVRSILEIAGYEVAPAGDGEEALSRVREGACELVVSDVQMPRLDGIGLVRAIRADPALARLPVILVTSLESPEDRAAGLHAGADGYLVKRQVESGQLLELVRQLVGRA